jgi:hypothetical protein
MKYLNWLGLYSNTDIENSIKDLNLLETKMKKSFSSSQIDKEKIKRDVIITFENKKSLKKSLSLSNIHYLEEEAIKNNELMNINKTMEFMNEGSNLNSSDIWLDKKSTSPNSLSINTDSDKNYDEFRNEIISEVTESVGANYDLKLRQLQDKVNFEMMLFDRILDSLKLVNKDYYYYKGMAFGITIGFGLGYLISK